MWGDYCGTNTYGKLILLCGHKQSFQYRMKTTQSCCVNAGNPSVTWAVLSCGVGVELMVSQIEEGARWEEAFLACRHSSWAFNTTSELATEH